MDDIKRCLMAVKPGSADYSPQIDVDSKIIFEGIPPAFKSGGFLVSGYGRMNFSASSINAAGQ